MECLVLNTKANLINTLMLSSRLKIVNLNENSNSLLTKNVKKYSDIGKNDLLEPLNRLDMTTESYEKETLDVLLCHKICFEDGYSLYSILENDIKEIVERVLVKNFSFFLKFVTSLENNQYLDLLYSLVYKHPEIMQRHFSYISLNTKNKKTYMSDFKSLYFGSKIFNKLAEYHKCDIKNYVEMSYKLFLSLVKEGSNILFGEFLLSIIKLSSFLAIDICFLNSNIQSNNSKSLFHSKDIFDEVFIKNIYEPSSTIVKKKLIYQVALLFDKIGSEENYATILFILKNMNAQYLDVDKVLTNCDNECFLTAFLKSCHPNSVKRIMVVLIMKWTNINKNDGSDANDLLLTKLILQCCDILIDFDFEKEFANKTFFINGVSKRLMNPSKGFVERTMIVSKRLTNDKIEFETELKIDLLEVSSISKELNFDALSYMNKQSVLVEIPKNLQDISTTSNDISRPELTDDMNKRIYFIKDFIKQLLSLSSQSSNNLNIVEVLNEGCKIMEIKIENGNAKEIDFYLNDIIPLLINIKPKTENDEKLPIENFRIRALVSTIKSNPKNAFPILLDYLFNKDLGIQTRLSLLTSLGLGCLEINEVKSSIRVDNKIDSEIEEVLLHDKLIRHSITKWRSKKLDKKDELETNQKTRYFKQQNITETLKVCFGLVNGWVNGIQLASAYDKIFKEHYLKLLIFVYGIIADYKHLDTNSELKRGVNKVILDGYQQGILLDKELMADIL